MTTLLQLVLVTPQISSINTCTPNLSTNTCYGGPVGRGYEQRFESKNEYEQRSESKIAYGPRAKLRTVQEQNCVRSESKIAYGLRAKLRTVREQNCVWSESKNAQELRAKMRTS